MPVRTEPTILMIGNFVSHQLGGSEVCEELAEQLRDSGWRVITSSSRIPRVARLWDMLSTTWRHRNAYRVAHIDVFSGPALIWAELVSTLLRLLHHPFILTLHGGDLPITASRSPRRLRRLLRSATLVTAPSDFLRTVGADLGCEVLLLPNPIDLQRYPYRHRAKVKPDLLWLRTFREAYNPGLAVRTLAQLLPNEPAATLRMIGHDKQPGCLRDTQHLARSLGIDQQLQFHPGVGKALVAETIAPGDIFLNTSNTDNTPVSVIEAMACGLCVVSTNVGGMPKLLTHEHDGLLVEPDDPEAMAAAVQRLLHEPGLAARLSRNARETARRSDWSIVLPRWQALFREHARRD